jgi:hypothetical protein
MRWFWAVASVLAAAALMGCTGGAPIGAPDGGATTATGCGGETISIPSGMAVPSPACSSPMTTPPPFPVAEADAAAAAARFTGQGGMEVVSRTETGAEAYLVSSSGEYVVVDGTTGRVLQVFTIQPDITNPDGGVPDWSPTPSPRPQAATGAAAATSIARAWLTGHGLAAASSGGTAVRDTLPLADAWLVTLTSGGSPVSLRVTDGGSVVGYQAPNPPLALALPRLSRDAAVSMAIARTVELTGRTDERLTAAEFYGSFVPGGLYATWMISTGIPGPDPSYGTVWSLGAAIEVDALTGRLTVDKVG